MINFLLPFSTSSFSWTCLHESFSHHIYLHCFSSLSLLPLPLCSSPSLSLSWRCTFFLFLILHLSLLSLFCKSSLCGRPFLFVLYPHWRNIFSTTISLISASSLHLSRVNFFTRERGLTSSLSPSSPSLSLSLSLSILPFFALPSLSLPHISIFLSLISLSFTPSCI